VQHPSRLPGQPLPLLSLWVCEEEDNHSIIVAQSHHIGPVRVGSFQEHIGSKRASLSFKPICLPAPRYDVHPDMHTNASHIYSSLNFMW
jgi:hypothetical protein